MTTTLGDALSVAETHWRGSRTRVSLAKTCVGILGGDNTPASSLTAAKHGVALLEGLRNRGLGPASINQAYRTFRQLLALVEVSTVTWPKAPKPPRRTRDRIKGEDVERLLGWLDQQGYLSTADLVRLVRAVGLRVNVEGLNEGAITVERGAEYDTLRIIGKGGHERVVPIVEPCARLLVNDSERMANMRATPYHTHRRRWNAGCAALGIAGRKLTFHSARHAFASEVYERTGGNLLVTQELLGHADPKTTARYVHNDVEALVKGVS